MILFRNTRSPFILLLFLSLQLPVYAGVYQNYMHKGDELYRTHHLSPERIHQAAEYYEKALNLEPKNYDILWKLSRIYQIHGQILPEDQKDKKIDLWKKGEAFGKEAIEVNPEGKEGHFYYMSNMGAIVKEKGAFSAIMKLRKIKKEMDKTFQLDPDYPPILIAQAQYLTELPAIFGRDEQKAVRLYERALEVDPNLVDPYYFLAKLDAKNKRYDEALAKLDKIHSCEQGTGYANCVKITQKWSNQLRETILRQKVNSAN